MLRSLYIRNLAVIEEIDLILEDGMTALTGETGAGKSILIDALGLLLGDRANPALIRAGCEQAEVSASFVLDADHPARTLLTEQGLDNEEECLVRRQIGRDGRSRAYLNGRPAAVQTLRELGEHLVDIHGQHEHQQLLQRPRQRELLDTYAALSPLALEVARLSRERKHALDTLERLRADGQQRADRLQLLDFQLEELHTLALEDDELSRLEEEQKRLTHASELREGSAALVSALYEADEGNLHDKLVQCLNQLQALSRRDPTLNEVTELLQGARIQIGEAADYLRHYTDRVDLDPEKLGQIEERLSLIHALARKHRVPPEELSTHVQALEQERAALGEGEKDDTRLQERIALLERQWRDSASRLGAAREDAASRLARRVSEAIQGLGMPHGRFEIHLTPLPEGSYAEHGGEDVEFFIAANPGQPAQPLAKVASGGELSRLSLALRSLSAAAGSVGTLIFDEVDSGIGGAVAEVVGRHLAELGQHRQVLCVTHLPQVAAQAQHQWRISKHQDERNTTTAVECLDEDGRIEELGRMLGGLSITEQTRAHAREMRDAARERAQSRR